MAFGEHTDATSWRGEPSSLSRVTFWEGGESGRLSPKFDSEDGCRTDVVTPLRDEEKVGTEVAPWFFVGALEEQLPDQSNCLRP